MSRCRKRTWANGLIICSSGRWVSEGMCVCMCVRALPLLLATAQRRNKSRKCCHKTATPRFLSGVCLRWELRKHYGEERAGREKERLKKEKAGRGRQRSKRGVSRPWAEGLIWNIPQRQCLRSSPASPRQRPHQKKICPPFPQKNRGKRKKSNDAFKWQVPSSFYFFV